MRKWIGPTLLIVIPTTLLAWVAVPNVIAARNGAKQSQTMADIRSIAAAWEARATDVNSYDVDHGYSAAKKGDDYLVLHHVRYADLERALVPTYIKKLPRQDGWGDDYDFATGDYDTSGAARVYSLRSLGGDGRAQPGPYVSKGITDFNDDLVFTNGEFLQYVEGT